jgi:hypothetical protein
VEGTNLRKSGELQNRGSAGRGRTENFDRGRKNRRENFQTVDDWDHGQIQSLRGNHGARRRTKLTGMRTAGVRSQIGTKVELRRQEDDSEQQSAQSGLVGVSEHLSTKTKLRLEWLRGQATDRGGSPLFASIPLARASKVLG